MPPDYMPPEGRANARRKRPNEVSHACSARSARMSCCDETTARVPDTDVSRRSVLKGASVAASVLPLVRPRRATAQGKSVKLAYCSQILCGVPYEVARSAGYFTNHGLNVELVYTRGGSAAMQALVG